MIKLIEEDRCVELVELLDYHDVSPTYALTAKAGSAYGNARAWEMGSPAAKHRFVVELFSAQDNDWHYGFCDYIDSPNDLALLMEFPHPMRDPVAELVHRANVRGLTFVVAAARSSIQPDIAVKYVILRSERRESQSVAPGPFIVTAVTNEGVYAEFTSLQAAADSIKELKMQPTQEGVISVEYAIVPIQEV